MPTDLPHRLHWIFRGAALTLWLTLGWQVLQSFANGSLLRGEPVPAAWLVAFATFGASMLAAMVFRLRPSLHWGLLGLQVAAVAAMAILVPWAMMTVFLSITAWQVAMATDMRTSLIWIAAQSLVGVAALAQALNPDMCWILGLSLALQLFFMSTAQLARTLTDTNDELRAAQAIIATSVRDAERLRISRELHDAWGHELTALGLQLEIASNINEPAKAAEHVQQAKGLARALLGKVRDVVSTLRDGERTDLGIALERLAESVPAPAVHVDIAGAVRVTAHQAHAFVRCAQEAVTNAIRHSDATNLWLRIAPDQGGVRLVARNDGTPTRGAQPGSGLLGMRERIEGLGGHLSVLGGGGPGFIIEAWLPAAEPAPA